MGGLVLWKAGVAYGYFCVIPFEFIVGCLGLMGFNYLGLIPGLFLNRRFCGLLGGLFGFQGPGGGLMMLGYFCVEHNCNWVLFSEFKGFS